MEASDGGRIGIDDWNDDALVDVEMEVGKFSKERKELVVVVKLDRMGKNCTDIICTQSGGAPICAICFLECLGRDIEGDNPEGPTEGAALVDARPLKKEKDKVRGDTQEDHGNKVHGINNRAEAKRKPTKFKSCKKPVVVDGAEGASDVIKRVAGPLAVHDTVCSGRNVKIDNVLAKLA